MKKLNNVGFTLIELLAVITIMGILMLVAIPAVSRTIENTRRDTFANTALEYISAIEQAVLTDAIECHHGASDDTATSLSALGAESYYYFFDSSQPSGKDLMEKGGKSSWGKAEVKGKIKITKTVNSNKNSYEYSAIMVDASQRGFGDYVTEANIKRPVVQTSGQTIPTGLNDTEKTRECLLVG